MRLYPIKISDPDDDSVRDFVGAIKLNDVEFQRELTWRTEDFLRLLKYKLGGQPITKIDLGNLYYDRVRMDCSSVTLNELLSVLYFHMAEDGLSHLSVYGFPEECDIDPNLMTDIATKAAPRLRTLILNNQKLQPNSM